MRATVHSTRQTADRPRAAAQAAPSPGSTATFSNQRPEAFAQQQRQQQADQSAVAVAQRQRQQDISAANSQARVPNQAERTGLPEHIRAGMERLSGHALDDVRVHYNSSKPASLDALAYTQGTDIHVGPGQEQHLPHEAWHVVQQKQGRVQPTMQMKGVNINDDHGLESEADRLGTRAADLGQRAATSATSPPAP